MEEAGDGLVCVVTLPKYQEDLETNLVGNISEKNKPHATRADESMYLLKTCIQSMNAFRAPKS